MQFAQSKIYEFSESADSTVDGKVNVADVVTITKFLAIGTKSVDVNYIETYYS